LALQAQLLLKMQDALREFLVLGLQRRDLGRVRRDQCFQLVRCGLATHRILESKSCSRVNRVPMSWAASSNEACADDAARIEYGQPTL
jgi:hypothetical protein